jgi:thioredoxin reductase (NADPH)
MPHGSSVQAVPRPTLVVVDDEDASRAAVARELTTRYSIDYSVLVESSPGEALQRLRDLGAAGDEVAVMLAEQQMAEMPGATFLAMAHEIHPRARRGLLITPTQNLVPRRATAQATVLGHADYFLIKPVQTPDERFHRAVTEFLDEWWRLRGSTFELIRVVGEERSRRSHEIRDLLQRHDLPYGFYASESEAGRAALAHAEASAERCRDHARWPGADRADQPGAGRGPGGGSPPGGRHLRSDHRGWRTGGVGGRRLRRFRGAARGVGRT